MTPQQIEFSLKEIQIAMEHNVSPEDIDLIQEKLCNLAGYLGTSAELIRYSRQLVLHKQQQVISACSTKGVSPSILKQMVEADLWYEISLHDYATRINAGLTHVIDGLRTVISLYGKELELSNKTKTFQT